MTSKLSLLIVVVVLVCVGNVLCADRVRRDVVCATFGNRVCPTYCKGKGYRDGTCRWDTEEGSYDCVCTSERAGIRCNLGGQNVCHYTCVARGYRSGSCDSALNRCSCSSDLNRWGSLLRNIADRF